MSITKPYYFNVVRVAFLMFVTVASGLGICCAQAGGKKVELNKVRRDTGRIKTFTGGRLRIKLQDHLDNPFYWWPRTLLSYPVHFKEEVTPDQLSFERLDSAGIKPFQLSHVKMKDGHLQSAYLNFFSDLPSGGSRTFVLTNGAPKASRHFKGPRTREHPSDDSSIVLNSGLMQVRLPTSTKVSGTAPGPIMQVSRDGGVHWFGTSRIVSPKLPVKSINTKQIESGPLFITYKITYQFANGGRYEATVRCIAGMDYVDFSEIMKGLAKKDSIYLKTTWSGLDPTYRQSPNHPLGQAPSGGKGYNRYDWERIDQKMIPHPNKGVVQGMNENGKISFHLGPYEPWLADRILRTAAFWNERTNNAIGIFINKMRKWRDHEYAIWHASSKLEVSYYYRNGVLSWRWPLANGTRSTAITFYNHRKDVKTMKRLEKMHQPHKSGYGFTYRANMTAKSHVDFLRNRYGTIDLNKVKDWKLTYSGTPPRGIFKEGKIHSVAGLMEHFFYSSRVLQLPADGTQANSGGINPVGSRVYSAELVDAFSRLYPKLNDAQQEHLAAMFLFMGYVYAGENLMPMQTMLGGHPNFLSDIKSLPGFIAFLFPKHPAAERWANNYEKFMVLNSRYHTRPKVEKWHAKGGRWTENLGTYVWAFLRPAIRTGYALKNYRSGKNRLVTPQIAQLGNWTVNALSAPFEGENLDFYRDANGNLNNHFWGIVTKAEGPRRVYPPQGAHSERRTPPRSLWLLGHMLRHYRPLTAEHMMWAARSTGDYFEDIGGGKHPWSIMYSKKNFNRGTNPHLKSSKYTGYGIILRAGVGSPNELSIHLQQIDEGPNYRWGIAGQGGSGVIYFFAGGKDYSHNGPEDVGDRRDQDTDFSTNFGVWKDGRFKSIGRNVLRAPMYNLGAGQFAKITSKKGPDAYSWPEYKSRSIMLVGTDYFVTYDDVFSKSVRDRFSWFTQINDSLPHIHVVKGVKRNHYLVGQQKTHIRTNQTKGVWYAGSGDFMTVISQKSGLDVERMNYGCLVKTVSSVDNIFRDDNQIQYSEGGQRFKGKAGFIRHKTSGKVELGLFHGTAVGSGGIILQVKDSKTGITGSFHRPGEVKGQYSSRKDTRLMIKWKKKRLASHSFYIDGKKQQVNRSGDQLSVNLPAGSHLWQVTAQQPVPPAPKITHTINGSGQTTVFFKPVGGAQQYRIETSRDNGASWQPAGTTDDSSYILTGLKNKTKIHIRVVAFNDQHKSQPSDEYPVYISGKSPASPDGLKLTLADDSVHLSWGKVLGVTGYRLYRKIKGQDSFKMIYEGLNQSYLDTGVNVIPAYSTPHLHKPLQKKSKHYTIYEYAVTTYNKNGESKKSYPANTNPASWLNWNPKPGERFRRRNYDSKNDIPVYYPKEL